VFPCSGFIIPSIQTSSDCYYLLVQWSQISAYEKTKVFGITCFFVPVVTISKPWKLLFEAV
jgi:hypothetical protein